MQVRKTGLTELQMIILWSFIFMVGNSGVWVLFYFHASKANLIKLTSKETEGDLERAGRRQISGDAEENSDRLRRSFQASQRRDLSLSVGD